MLRSLSKQAFYRRIEFSSEPNWFAPSFASRNYIQHCQSIESARAFGATNHRNCERPDLGIRQISIFGQGNEMGIRSFLISSIPFGFSGGFRGYGCLAEAIVSTSEEDIDEIQEIIEEIDSEKKAAQSNLHQPKQQKLVGGLGMGKYHILRRKQMKMETEAWEEAAREYQELLADMCEQKLAPNLPYMKSLFLGWFGPLRDAVLAE